MARGTDYDEELRRDPDEVVGMSVRLTRRRRMQINAIAEARRSKKPGGWGANALVSNEIDKLVRRHRDLLPEELRD